MDRIRLLKESDIVIARNAIRELADINHFSILAKTQIAAAVGELSRNTIIHGGGGYMEYESVTDLSNTGLKCHFVDTGPGCILSNSLDVNSSEEKNWSDAALFGHGLRAVRYLVDDFRFQSEKGKGTAITILKWSSNSAF